mgnify:CR=1 FL=1
MLKNLTMQKITPFLWFDKEAQEAAKFYSSVFKGKITSKSIMNDTPSGEIGTSSGTVEIYNVEIHGLEFTLMSAGPLFKINPSISFHVKCPTIEEVDALWKKLSEKGEVLMELGKYPFNERYGWCNDKYGVSWQIIHTPKEQIKQKIVPILMFVGKVCGKAKEAIHFYTSLFKNSKIGSLTSLGR